MTSDAWFLVLSVALWAVIVAVWAWWIRARLVRRRRLEIWPRVAARVTKAWVTREANGNQPYWVWHAEYEFADPAGQMQHGKHHRKRQLSEGDELEVMYDPADPSSHDPVHRAQPLWATILVLVFFTLGVSLFAVITLLLGLGFE